MRRISFMVFSEDADVCAHISEGLLATQRVRIQSTVSESEVLSAEIQQTHVEGIYIDTDVAGDPSVLFDAVTSLPEPRPLILFGGKHDDPQVLLKAMRAGGRDFFVGHKLEGLKAIIDSAAPKQSVSSRPAPIVAVVGAKGGVGATTLGCELAVVMEESGTRTIVIDLDLRSGDVPLYFDLQTPYCISDLVRKDGELDETLVDAVVAEHSSGVSILASPSRFEDLGVLNYPQLDRIIKFLEKDYDLIVFDLPWGFDEFSLRSLDRASHIVLITTPDVPSLNHTRARLELMERFGNDPDRIRVVLNRHSKTATFNAEQVAEFLECAVESEIPDQPEATQECMNEGKLLRDAREGVIIVKAMRVFRDKVAEWCKLEIPESEPGEEEVPLGKRLRNLLTRS